MSEDRPRNQENGTSLKYIYVKRLYDKALGWRRKGLQRISLVQVAEHQTVALAMHNQAYVTAGPN
jgi:hypothetical protein